MTTQEANVTKSDPTMPLTTRFRPYLVRTVWSVVLLSILAYVGVGFWFVVNESRFIYHPSRTLLPPQTFTPLKYERVDLLTPDHVKLAGWVMRSHLGDSTGTWVLYFHGNTGNIADCADRYQELQLLGVNVFAGDYRGYGESEGRPDEAGLYVDAACMFDYLTSVLRVPPHKIVLYGYSLGSGVAIELARRCDASALIVEGAFTSVPDRGQELYGLLPVRLLARNRFDSIGKIGSLRLPKLIIHAVDDTIVPFAHGKALFQRAAEPKDLLVLQGGHVDGIFVDSDTYLAGVMQFLAAQRLIPMGRLPALQLPR